MSLESDTRSALHVKLHKMHESTYLTLMSIVQGVALSVLASNLPKDVGINSESILFLATFGFIVLLWNEYAMGIATFTWIPKLLDAFIPFAFCLAEIAMASSVRNAHAWFFSAAAFLGLGMIAFVNLYWRAGQNPANSLALDALGRFKAISVGMCAAFCVLFLACGLVGRIWIDALLPSFALVLLAIAVIRAVVYWECVVKWVLNGGA